MSNYRKRIAKMCGKLSEEAPVQLLLTVPRTPDVITDVKTSVKQKRPRLDPRFEQHCTPAQLVRPDSSIMHVRLLRDTGALQSLVTQSRSDTDYTLPRLQSAYHAGHSTEIAVLKVLSDILLAIDASDLSALLLLDLSAAFDAVDHDILIRRLKTSFVWCGAAVVPDILDRPAPVCPNRILGIISDTDCVWCTTGVGSRPILFLLYTVDLILLIQGHGLCTHLYADDTQIYGFCRPSASLELQNTNTSCVDVGRWMCPTGSS